MTAKLLALMSKPDINAQNTNNLYLALWDDDHISKGMLSAKSDTPQGGLML